MFTRITNFYVTFKLGIKVKKLVLGNFTDGCGWLLGKRGGRFFYDVDVHVYKQKIFFSIIYQVF